MIRRFLITNPLTGSLSSLSLHSTLPLSSSRCFFHCQRKVLQALPKVEITHTKNINKELFEKDSLDSEKEDLFPLRRLLAYHHDQGDYGKALELALEMQEKVAAIYGTKNTVYASSLSNLALMFKLKGDEETAMKHYLDALQLYYNLQGKETSNNAKILGNIGKLYLSMAQKAKGVQRTQLLERAKEALFDSLEIRLKIHGNNHKETITAKILIASFYQSQSQIKDATSTLTECLSAAQANYGKEDPLTGTILNNLGYLHKSIGALNEAKEFYSEAVNIRSKVLGDNHPDTIIVKHNLSECLLAMGREAEAHALKQELLSIIEKRQTDDVSDAKTPSSTSTSPPSTPTINAVSPEEQDDLNSSLPEEKVEKKKVEILTHPPHMKAATRKKRPLV